MKQKAEKPKSKYQLKLERMSPEDRAAWIERQKEIKRRWLDAHREEVNARKRANRAALPPEERSRMDREKYEKYKDRISRRNRGQEKPLRFSAMRYIIDDHDCLLNDDFIV